MADARRRRPGRRRTRRDWARRLGLASIAAVAGYLSVTFSTAQVIAKADPQRAYRLAPYDGRIAARIAAARAGTNGGAFDPASALRYARIALSRDATAVGAVSAIGLVEDRRRAVPAARRAFAYAERLSRRDLVTQLWAIEAAVAQGDVRGALRHYDVALRTKPATGPLLFPVLITAAGEPAIRTELIRTFAARPRWSGAFFDFATNSPNDPVALANLYAGLSRVRVAVPGPARSAVVDALLVKARYDDAWRFYRSYHPGADRQHSRDPEFAADPAAGSRLDWRPADDVGVTMVIDRGAAEFSAPPGVGGPLLRQAQLLQPGRYRLGGRTAELEQAQKSRPYWSLACASGRELGRVEVPNSAIAGGRFAGTITVPSSETAPGCALQTLTLVARPSEATAGLTGRVERMELVPAS